jgi:hypothetical protein
MKTFFATLLLGGWALGAYGASLQCDSPTAPMAQEQVAGKVKALFCGSEAKNLGNKRLGKETEMDSWYLLALDKAGKPQRLAAGDVVDGNPVFLRTGVSKILFTQRFHDLPLFANELVGCAEGCRLKKSCLLPRAKLSDEKDPLFEFTTNGKLDTAKLLEAEQERKRNYFSEEFTAALRGNKRARTFFGQAAGKVCNAGGGCREVTFSLNGLDGEYAEMYGVLSSQLQELKKEHCLESK